MDDFALKREDSNSVSSSQNSGSLEPRTVYTATYSGVKVLEMTVNGISVMRRRQDSSFNATQILKVGGQDKAKRTKILEKEIHTGVHEKVQGGYGKFQGTWIPYDRAVALAQQYDVYNELKPLFLFNAANETETPTKEQAAALARKKISNPFHQSFGRQPSSLSRGFSTLTDADETELVESPTKKQKVSNLSSAPVEIFEHDLQIENPNTPFTLDPLPFTPELSHSKDAITQIFLSKDTDTPVFPSDISLDVTIDELGHTALHWASSLARISLVHQLISNGAIRIRGNNAGESPLVRSVLVTNNYDQSTFDELLNLLYPCIPLLDHQRRSILHHIALTAGIKKRSAASRYYLESLLSWIVTKSTTVSRGAITLGKFMTDIVNSQDRNGDTPLNIAARIGNKAIMQQLLDVGADPSIPNKAGLRPIDFGISLNGLTNKQGESNGVQSGTQGNVSAPALAQQSSSKILESMHQVLSRLDNDFQSEISIKQEKIDTLHQKLRTSTVTLSNNRKTLENLKTLEVRLNDLKQKKLNIEKAISEEEEKFLSETTDLDAFGMDVEFDADEPFRVLPIYDYFLDQIHAKQQSVNPSISNGNDDDAVIFNEHDIDSLDIEYNNQQINISALPPPSILKARINAYSANESQLQSILSSLKMASEQLESKFRRVVSLCTGVDEEQIDGILDGLVQAVESDPDEVDMSRVVGFLRKVEE